MAPPGIPGIDVSRHQGTINWPSVAGSGKAYAFLKATDGIRYSYVNWFHQNRGLAWDSGLIVGAYHFLLDHYHGGAQADFYVNEVNRSGGFYGVVPILDVEREADGTTPGIRQVREFVQRFRERVPNRPILIYTGRWYWVGVIGNPYGADLGPLWHSEYDGATPIHFDVANGPELEKYGGWTDCLVWQHTSSGKCPGVTGACDLNLFYGSHELLLQLAGLRSGSPTPPSQGDWLDMASEAEVRTIVREEVEAAERRIIQQVLGNKPLIVAFDDVEPGEPDHWFSMPAQTRGEVTQEEAAQAVAQGNARWWNPQAPGPVRVPRPTLEQVHLVEDPAPPPAEPVEE